MLARQWLSLLKFLQFYPDASRQDINRATPYQPCFATRLGGVSGGKVTQEWPVSSHTAIFGAGKLGSAKLPIATVMNPGKPSFAQKTVEPQVGQKWKVIALPLGCPHPLRRFTGESNLVEAKARLIANDGTGTALAR